MCIICAEQVDECGHSSRVEHKTGLALQKKICLIFSTVSGVRIGPVLALQAEQDLDLQSQSNLSRRKAGQLRQGICPMVVFR